jgi:hypothetical protein
MTDPVAPSPGTFPVPFPSDAELSAAVQSGRDGAVDAATRVVASLHSTLADLALPGDAQQLLDTLHRFTTVSMNDWRTRSALVTPISVALDADPVPLHRILAAVHALPDTRVLGEGGATYLDDAWPGDLADAVYGAVRAYPLRPTAQHALAELAAVTLHERPPRRRPHATLDLAVRWCASAVRLVDDAARDRHGADPECADFRAARLSAACRVFFDASAADPEQTAPLLAETAANWSDEEFDRLVHAILATRAATSPGVATQRPRRECLDALLASGSRLTPGAAELSSLIERVRSEHAS